MPPYSESDKDSSSAQRPNLEVLYEDNHLIAVNKPAGLLVQGDSTGETSLLDLVREWLRITYRKPGNVFVGLIHRLDRPVCGVVVFAKTSKGAGRLSEQFRSRSVSKIYRAWVEGVPSPSSADLAHYLSSGEGSPISASSDPGDDRKLARLSYRLLSTEGGKALLEVRLDTGRKHQIRVQLAALGHPIVGDRKYGARLPWGSTGIGLCSVCLTFHHPIRSEEAVHLEHVPDAFSLGRAKT